MKRFASNFLVSYMKINFLRLLQCSGLCWFHGSLKPEEIQLRLAVVEPTNGAFLIIKGPKTLYQINIWIEGKVVSMLSICSLLTIYEIK